MDHTISFQTITLGDTTQTSNPSEPLVSGVSFTSIAIPTSYPTVSVISTVFTAPSEVSQSTAVNSTSSSAIINTNSIPTFSSASASAEPTNLSPYTAPPASVYTTGIYIALGLFVFFGTLCALVTSPAIAKAVKAYVGRRTRRSEQSP
jgi:hypothetical protein